MSSKITAFPGIAEGHLSPANRGKWAKPREGQADRAHGASLVSDLSFQLLFSSNPNAMVALDRNRRVQMCNPAFENLFQFKEADIVGADLDSLLAPGELVKEAREFSLRSSAGEVIRANTQRCRRDGSLVEVQITACRWL